jgi:glycosidase
MKTRESPGWVRTWQLGGALTLLLAVSCSTMVPAHEPVDVASLSIAPGEGDAWAWTIEERGRSTGPRALDACDVVVNARRAPARVEGDSWSARVSLDPGENVVHAECRDGRGIRLQSPLLRIVERLPPAPAAHPAPAATRETGPATFGSTVVYGLAPCLYGDPPLRAVTAALPDLADLGVDVVWLTPTFESPASDFGYAVTDYFKVRSTYGTSEDLARLVQEAHRLGLRVLLDLPANATSDEHPYFRSTGTAESRYFDFYVRDPQGRAVHEFDWSNLPDLNYRDGEASRWITEASLFWIHELGIDGYRLDAAWGPRERAPDFWPAWVRALRSAEPHALLVAEGPASDPYYRSAGFDLAYDWKGIGHGSWGEVFDVPEKVPDRVRRALEGDGGAAPTALRFLENNDTGPRFVTRHGVGMTWAAAALLFTVPGVPCLFAGQERGVEYEPYAWHGSLPLGSAPELRGWYGRLIDLRRAHPALWRGTLASSGADHGPVVSFVRTDAASGESLLVMLNLQARPASTGIKEPRGTRWLRELISGQKLGASQDGTVHVDLPPWGAALVVLNEPQPEQAAILPQ